MELGYAVLFSRVSRVGFEVEWPKYKQRAHESESVERFIFSSFFSLFHSNLSFFLFFFFLIIKYTTRFSPVLLAVFLAFIFIFELEMVT